MTAWFLTRIRATLRRDRDVPASHKLVKAARWIAQRATAKVRLSACDAVGSGARTQERPVIENYGRITIGARAILNSMFAPITLSTGPRGVLSIGDDVALNFGVRIAADRSVTIGDRVAFGPEVSVDDRDDDGVDDGAHARAPASITIGDDVWLAARVRVRKGAVIGRGAVIMAGSEVRGEIAPGVVAGGVPARALRMRVADVAPEPIAASPIARASSQRGVVIADFSAQELRRHLGEDDPLGPSVDAQIAPFDQVVPALLDLPRRARDEALTFALVWTRPDAIASFRRLRGGEEIALEEILAEVDAHAALLCASAGSIRTVFVASYVLPADERGVGMRDLRPGGVAHAIAQMNARLVDALATATNVFVLNAQRWIDVAGRDAVSDKLWYLAKIGFSREVLIEAGRDVRAGLRGVAGEAKKLIVVDLDDTLWGGIVGDVGWQGLQLGGHDAVGEAHVDFQRGLKALARRGVLLAIASKNDDAIAVDAIAKHPEMALRLDDFSARRINWGDKAANIVELANELNLGLQSIVFLDDNPVERARVREELPEVYVPEWPTDALGYAEALRSLRCFDVPSVSREDGDRTRLYVQERTRQALKNEVGSLEAWLSGLGLCARFSPLDAASLTRATQLLNKTNQMNLSTRRLSEAELMAWVQQPGDVRREVWTLSVSDRIGDAGLTGLFAIEVGADRARLCDFVLSCRVMGRQIEETMLAVAIARARTLGATTLEVERIPTEKNGPCRAFLERSRLLSAPATERFSWPVADDYAAPSFVRVEGAVDAIGR